MILQLNKVGFLYNVFQGILQEITPLLVPQSLLSETFLVSILPRNQPILGRGNTFQQNIKGKFTFNE